MNRRKRSEVERKKVTSKTSVKIPWEGDIVVHEGPAPLTSGPGAKSTADPCGIHTSKGYRLNAAIRASARGAPKVRWTIPPGSYWRGQVGGEWWEARMCVGGWWLSSWHPTARPPGIHCAWRTTAPTPSACFPRRRAPAGSYSMSNLQGDTLNNVTWDV